jgi:hypothetical protein
MASIDKCLGYGESRQYVPRCSTTGYHRKARHRGRRATFINNPAHTIDTISDVPPKEMNGSVRPVTGMIPTTPPMLITI